MARVQKVKPNSRSRAARRAASPSLDVDKSLIEAPRLEEDKEHVVNVHKNTGIFKKSKDRKKTRAQKLRQQKGVARAADIIDRTQVKVQKSVTRGNRVKSRRAAWEELNPAKTTKNPFQLLGDKNDANAMETESTTMETEETGPNVSGFASAEVTTSANPFATPAAANPDEKVEEEKNDDDDLDLIT